MGLIGVAFPTQQSIHRNVPKNLKQQCICNRITFVQMNSKEKKNKVMKTLPGSCMLYRWVSVHPRNSPTYVHTQVTPHKHNSLTE